MITRKNQSSWQKSRCHRERNACNIQEAAAELKNQRDINALCDEYLRLAYHGLRAKDKSFNAITRTEFDNTIGKINVMPQEIGRVILNLIIMLFMLLLKKRKQLVMAMNRQ
jgi:hypothetical protein